MSKIFTRTFRVRFAETNAYGWIGPAESMRYLIETASDWGEAGGFGAHDSQVLGIAWVVRENEFHFYHPLRHNDVFDFTIWMTDWKRVRGWRSFEMRLQDTGQLAAAGNQQLVSLDSQTLHPKTPPESIMANYRIPDPPTFESTFTSEIAGGVSRLPEHSTKVHRTLRTVEWRDIDHQGHVNNAVYASYVEQAVIQAVLNAGWTPERLQGESIALAARRIYLKYHSPAVWDDVLEIENCLLALYPDGGLNWVVIRRPTDNAHILEGALDWRLAALVSQQAVSLPEDLVCSLQAELPPPA